MIGVDWTDPLGTLALSGPIVVPASDDDDDDDDDRLIWTVVGMMTGRGKFAQCHFPTYPTWLLLVLNPGLCGKNSVTNCLSCKTA
jgi:hypothetical protein